MMCRAVPSPYPWEALDSLDRAAARSAGRARRRLGRALTLDKLEAALGATLLADASIYVHGVSMDEAPSKLPGARVHLELGDGSGRLVVGLDPELASLAVARVLGRPAELESPDLPLGPSLSGALAAIVLEVGRRASGQVALRVAHDGPRKPTADGVTVRASVVLGDRAYQALVWADCPASPALDWTLNRSLEDCAELLVSLPLVGGLCTATFAELASLRPGDAWSCGDGWMFDSRGIGAAALAAPGDDFGVAVSCVEGGQIVVRGDRVTLPVDLEESRPMSEGNPTLTEALLDAPIVVRVEVGAVSMTVRDWTKLGPGDVIETGCRIADPVVLRVAGREVARGELVNVEGQLGVRIRELATGENAAWAQVPG